MKLPKGFNSSLKPNDHIQVSIGKGQWADADYIGINRWGFVVVVYHLHPRNPITLSDLDEIRGVGENNG